MELRHFVLFMTKFIMLFIIILAVGLRFYQLGSNPPSLDWDEVSLGYNAYSILKTGADEYGNKLPLSIRSFDDYKPPLYTYLAILPIALFGLNEFSIRFPSAIFGVLAIFITYFLVKESLSNWDEKTKKIIAFISMFFVAISPWHLQFSRAAFEANIGLSFFLLGILFFFKGLKAGKGLILSSVFFILSSYSYHSFRLLAPFLIIIVAVMFRKELLWHKRTAILSFIIVALLIIPIAQSFFSSQGVSSRLSMVTIFDSDQILNQSIKRIEYDRMNKDFVGSLLHNRRIAYGLAIVKGYLDHFNPDFLFLHGDGGRQHHAVDVGMLYLWELPFILIGIYFLLKKLNKKTSVLFILFLIAPIPSAVTTGTPHPVRAIAMIPMFQIFSAVGVFIFFVWVLRVKSFYEKAAILIAVFLIGVANLAYYFHQYYVHTPIEYGDFWQYGHKEVFEEIGPIEDKYSKIVMTYMYDQPYIYYLFYNKIDPSWYQKNWDYNGNGQLDRFKRVIGKYEFRNIDWGRDKNLKNTLFIGTSNEIPDDVNIIKEIKFLDGSIAFRIAQT